MKPAKLLVAISTFMIAALANATLVDFTGGTVTRHSGLPITAVTDNTANYDNADFYVENGFLFDFLGNSGTDAFATHVGDYYGVGNDVIHGHWAGGPFGDMTEKR